MSEHYFKLEVELTMFLAGSPLLSQKGYGKGGGGNPKVSKGRTNGIAQAENKRPGADAAGILSKSTVEEILISTICCGACVHQLSCSGRLQMFCSASATENDQKHFGSNLPISLSFLALF